MKFCTFLLFSLVLTSYYVNSHLVEDEDKSIDAPTQNNGEAPNSGDVVRKPAKKVRKPKTDEDDKNKPRFQVKKWNGVMVMSLNNGVDNCAICRNPIEDLCIQCQADQNTEGCITAYGVCNHPFHYHCIDRWLKTRNVCPLDNREWELWRLGD